jgi:probable phosphoglycerate mutase
MTVTTLIIARHGNTFNPGEAPRRVGSRTDIPLVPSGHEQARKLGAYLHEHNLIPNRILTSHLQRARQTADIAGIELGIGIPIETTDRFNEIDYGPDENNTEDLVKARLGEQALKDWDAQGIMPDGWSPSASDIKAMWMDFSADLLRNQAGTTTMAVTSNGIARFALHLTGDWDGAKAEHGLKMGTGALSILTHRQDSDHWSVVGWNIRP